MSLKDLVTDFLRASDDSTLSVASLEALKAIDFGYLGATLQSLNPELRRMFLEFTVEVAEQHQALSELVVRKGWFQWRDPIETQLQRCYNASLAATPRESRE